MRCGAVDAKQTSEIENENKERTMCNGENHAIGTRDLAIYIQIENSRCTYRRTLFVLEPAT